MPGANETIRLAKAARIHQLAADPQDFQKMSLIMQVNNRRDINDLRDSRFPAVESCVDELRSTLQEQKDKVSTFTDAVIALQTSEGRQDKEMTGIANGVTELQTALEGHQLELNTLVNKHEVLEKSVDELGHRIKIGILKPQDKLFLEGLAQKKEMFDRLLKLVSSSESLYVFDKIIESTRDKFVNAELPIDQVNHETRAEPARDVLPTASEEHWPKEVLDAWSKLEQYTKYFNTGRCLDERKLILHYMEHLHHHLFKWCQNMLLAKCSQVERLKVPLVRGKKKRIVNINGLKWVEFRRTLRRVNWHRIAEHFRKTRAMAAKRGQTAERG